MVRIARPRHSLSRGAFIKRASVFVPVRLVWWSITIRNSGNLGWLLVPSQGARPVTVSRVSLSSSFVPPKSKRDEFRDFKTHLGLRGLR